MMPRADRYTPLILLEGIGDGSGEDGFGAGGVRGEKEEE